MKKVNISTLKNQLSRYLAMVRKGEEVLVMDRNTAVAKLVQVAGPYEGMDEEDRLRKLEEEGVVCRPKIWGIPPRLLKKPIKTGTSVLQALLDERQEGR